MFVIPVGNKFPEELLLVSYVKISKLKLKSPVINGISL